MKENKKRYYMRSTLNGQIISFDGERRAVHESFIQMAHEFGITHLEMIEVEAYDRDSRERETYRGGTNPGD